MGRRPRVCVLAGPNGAGKTTSAAPLVRDRWGIATFVNADVIAQGLAGFAADAAAIAAGRLMLEQLDALARERADFAFETTLASRSFLPRLAAMRAEGYEVLLVFLWLPAVELALLRVKERVRSGGHDVPEATVRRRFRRGIANFHGLYRPAVDRWWCLDGSRVPPQLVAEGEADSLVVHTADVWQRILDAT
jgi:predicted ABC-type ATPase